MVCHWKNTKNLNVYHRSIIQNRFHTRSISLHCPFCLQSKNYVRWRFCGSLYAFTTRFCLDFFMMRCKNLSPSNPMISFLCNSNRKFNYCRFKLEWSSKILKLFFSLFSILGLSQTGIVSGWLQCGCQQGKTRWRNLEIKTDDNK